MCGFYALQQIYPYLNVALFPLATASHMAGVWTVTVVTLHRYIAVCLPHHVAKFASLRVARLQVSPPVLLTVAGGVRWICLLSCVSIN